MKVLLFSWIVILSHVFLGCATKEKTDSREAKILKAKLKWLKEFQDIKKEYEDQLPSIEDIKSTLVKAEQGDTSSLMKAGFIFKHGTRVSKSERLAFQYFMKAAKQGCSLSQRQVSSFYEKGTAVIQDDIKAYAWANVANASDKNYEIRSSIVSASVLEHIANQKKINTQNFERLKNKLTKDQIAVSQALANNLFEEIYTKDHESPVNRLIH